MKGHDEYLQYKEKDNIGGFTAMKVAVFEDRLMEKFELDKIQNALRGRKLEVFTLKRCGHSFKKISKILGISEPSVKSYWRKLKKMWNQGHLNVEKKAPNSRGN